MLKLFSLKEAFPVCDAVGSEVRLEILEQLVKFKSVNLDTLAKNLHLTNGALTKHIRKLENAGIIRTKLTKGKRGYQKECSLKADKILIQMFDGESFETGGQENIPIGLYSDIKVNGLCGLCGKDGFIGRRDDATVFNSQKRAEAAALWLQNGSVTYTLPVTRELLTQKINELSLSFEISPDIIGNGRRHGEISFSFGGEVTKSIKIYPPADSRRGFLTPAWFDSSLPQYGTLALIRITDSAAYLDGERISGSGVQSLLSEPRFTISTDSGFFLFGADFGDYNQDLRFGVSVEDV